MQRINHKRTQKKSEPQMGFEPTTLRVLDRMLFNKKCLTHEGASNQPTYATDMGETFLINVTV